MSARVPPAALTQALSTLASESNRCVACGLCLPHCPTYRKTESEADSPRGRVMLMRGLFEGALAVEPNLVRHLDRCLACRACEAACPSGAKAKGSGLYFIPNGRYACSMTRPLRLEFPGAVYHITARGDGREDIYLDDADRLVFLDLLGKEVRQQWWRLYAYCLMSNHYHLLLETPEGNLVAGMRRLNGVYTQAFNRRHGRVGHVLQGRYKSILVDKDSYLLELARYIVLNPVRANMVKRVEDWPWSSYQATAGRIEAPDWLGAEWMWRQFGADAASGQPAYRRFVLAGLGATSPWEELRSQIYLGGDKFLARMAKLAEGQERQGVPKSHREPARPTAEKVLADVAKAFRIAPEQVVGRTSQAAFKAWVYLLRRATNLNLREVAEMAHVSPGRISQIQRALEGDGGGPELERLMIKYKVKT